MTCSDSSAIRPIHYLGSKLRLLDSINDALDYVDPSKGPVCDLFSGSGTVSNYLINKRDVYAVDIQNYSTVLCTASIKCLEQDVSIAAIMNSIKQSQIRMELEECFASLIDYEKHCTEIAKNGTLDSLYEIIEKGSIYIFINENKEEISPNLKASILSSLNKLKNRDHLNSLNSMITRYFGGLYFSYFQALQLDVISWYTFLHEGLIHDKLLAALLSTTSEIVNTVGKQFAQPLKVRDSDGCYKKNLLKKILEDRSLDVYPIFEKWLTYYVSAGTNLHSFESFCMNYTDALDILKNKNIKAVYADPPYTRYHYSRYYHVLETICLRDNPKVTYTFPNGKGGLSRAVYREGRFQSSFCIKSKAEQAFDEMFSIISKMGIPLVLSYSPFDESKAVTPRLRTIDQLVIMAKKYYNSVEIRNPGEFTHSKLNAVDKNFESNHEAELLLVCH